MKFGFDLDGCLCQFNATLYKLVEMLPPETREYIEQVYLEEAKPLLNPEFFVSDEDEYYIITGRSLKYLKITTAWANKYCPNYKKLIMVDCPPIVGKTESVTKEWSLQQAKLKADAINEFKIDVFFDDNLAVVQELRRLCMNTKVVKFGGRIGI